MNGLIVQVEIQPTSPDLSNNGRIERAIPYALTKDDASALFTADETVKIAGNISYDNGFGEQIVMPVFYEFLSRIMATPVARVFKRAVHFRLATLR